MDDKVGILTIAHTLNYGAELQAYALSKAVEKLGFEAEIIDYVCPQVQTKESILPSFGEGKVSIKSYIGKLLKLPEASGRKKRFVEFERNFMNIGDKLSSASDIVRAYRRIVVGSDQVWSPGIVGNDTTYLLADKISKDQKFISYAASFGDDSYTCGYADEYTNGINRFDTVSVRESTGLDVLRNLGRSDGVVVLDPTLLLNREEWLNLAMKSSIRLPNCYLFAYGVTHRERTFKYALKMAKKLGLEVLYIDAYGGKPVRGGKNMGWCSPIDFVRLVENASLVVTSSFHGLCFAVSFGRQVRYVTSNSKNNRLDELAGTLGIASSNIGCKQCDLEIDYQRTEKRLELLRAESTKYLQQALS